MNYARFASATALVAVLATIALCAVRWPSLPERIPTHFGVTGTADHWGSKATILVLPAVSLGLHGMLWLISRIPRRVRSRVGLSPADRDRLHELNAELLATVDAVVTLGFLYITHAVIRTAEGSTTGLGVAFLPILLAAVFLPMAYYVRRMSRLGRTR